MKSAFLQVSRSAKLPVQLHRSCLTALGLAATLIALPASAQVSFLSAQNFAVGDAPTSVTAGDLDRDGDLDLATANTFVDTVSILQSTTPTLQLSPSPNRTNPTPLAGGSVSGNIYVFASGKDSDFLRVRFFLDDPTQSSESFSLELAAPFDFASGTVSTANAFNTRTLTNGQHTITATFARTNGTIRTITSTFTVSN